MKRKRDSGPGRGEDARSRELDEIIAFAIAAAAAEKIHCRPTTMLAVLAVLASFSSQPVLVKPVTPARAIAVAAAAEEGLAQPPAKPPPPPALPVLRRLATLTWPDERRLQIRFVGVCVLVLCDSLMKAAVPLAFKGAVDALGAPLEVAAKTAVATRFVLLYAGLKCAQGSADALRRFLFVGVHQAARRRLMLRVMGHLLGLSHRFHTTKKTGEVMQVVDRGSDALERLLDLLPFRLIPVCLDVCLAVTVLTRVGQPLVAAIAFATLCAYAGVTLALTQWRTRYWRAMVEAEREAKGLAVEALMNVETVKLFAAEEYEVAKYAAQFGAILAQFGAILRNSAQSF